MNNENLHELASSVKFDPRESCTFNPTDEKQMVELFIKNDSSQAVLTKLKSTRPKHYKMKPVFAILQPGEKKPVKLVFNGFPDDGSEKPSKKDHFTVVYTPAQPDADLSDPKRSWREVAESQDASSAQGLIKKTIRIKYIGFNDSEPDEITLPEVQLASAPPLEEPAN